MSFGNITGVSKTFADRGNGLYMDSTVSFGDPSNVLKIRPNSNQKSPSATLQRTKQVDYTAPGQTAPRRISANVAIIITMPAAGFATSAASEMIQDLADFCSADNLTKVFQGQN